MTGSETFDPSTLLRRAVSLLLIIALTAGVSCKRAGTKPAPAAPAAVPAAPPQLDKGWPRAYMVNDNEVILQQPQIDEWRNYTTLIARIAVTVTLKDTQEPVNGIVELKGTTVTNHETRIVTLYRPEITAIRFPGTTPDLYAKLSAVVASLPPAKEYTDIALDRVLAYVERGQATVREANVNLDPPPIFYSDADAILVSFLGQPRFSPIEGTSLEFGLNTNWDVIRDPKDGRVYLLYRDSWLVTNDVMKGSWAPATALPPDMKNLPKDEVWGRVSQSVPGQPVVSMPRVFVSDRPGEVIVTKGRPQFEAIPGTNLAAVANSENTLFYHQGDHNFYFLAAGRWFRARDLTGPWSPATKTLPLDFAAIPQDDPRAYVLASVPGTQEANDAVLLASIPTTAVVNRKEAKAEVVYDGEPKFQQIEKTSVQYAVNTANDVFRIGSMYYVCYNGVWFLGSSPEGPWSVADSVPSEIYTIPPTSPKYNVTYVNVYETTPTTVTYGYTSGYNGEMVAAGIVMFGLGLVVANNADYYYGYYPPYCWGYGPRPIPYYGHVSYYSGVHGYGWSAHGPYGGAGYGARYNPHTGAYTRGGYAYGPGGGAAWRAGYNPHTGTVGAQRGGYNVYGSWSQTAVRNGDDWARGARYSNSEGTAAGFRTSGGAAGVGYRGDEGSGYVVRGQNGNIYAGKDGNVYRRGENGEWSNANRGGASTSSYDRSGSAAAQRSGSARAEASAAGRGSGGDRAPAATTSDRKQLSGGFGASASTADRPQLSGGFGASQSGGKAAQTTRPDQRSYGGGSGGGGYSSSAATTSSLNRDYQARQSGNERAARSSSYGGGSSYGGSSPRSTSNYGGSGRSSTAAPRAGGGRRR